MASWSNLRKKVRERFAPSIKGRVDIHYTIYEGKTSDGFVEAKHWSFWITVDGAEQLRLGCCGPVYLGDKLESRGIARREVVNNHSAIGPDEVIRALKQSLNMAIDAAINHPNPIIRAFAIADERLGKRRLRCLDIESLHAMERLFYDLRFST